MKLRQRDLFAVIRTEGAILPADLLQRIADDNRALGGLTPEAYHLVEGEKLNEATNRSWNHLQGAWAGLRPAMEKLPEKDPGTSITREKWLLPLFQELGYGRLPSPKQSRSRTRAIRSTWVAEDSDPPRRLPCRPRPPCRGVPVPPLSPHSLVQELLNRSDDAPVGFVSNGLQPAHPARQHQPHRARRSSSSTCKR